LYPGTFALSAPQRPAVITGGGEVVTYRQLDARSTQFARFLLAAGLQHGDVIAVFMENNARYHEVCWGARRIGLYFVTVSSHLTADEIAYILADSGARVLVSSATVGAVAGQLTPGQTPSVQHRLMIGEPLPGWQSYDDVVGTYPTERVADEVEGDLLQYSSGTTGRPKGIKRPLSLAPMSAAADGAVPFLQAIGFGEGDVYLSPAPLYHTAPLFWSSAVHRLGGTVVVMEKFDAARALELIARHRVTHSLFVPTMFVRMLKLDERVRRDADVSSLRTVIHAAAPCPVEIKRQMIEWWGPLISEFYSSSEGAGATFITAEDWLQHPGSVGRPVLGTPHILDDEGREVPPLVTGQIWFDGGPQFEYHNDPAKTAEAVNERGWASVGDVGYLDEDGYLFLTDRKAFMIISGGVNIYPQEAENALVTHPYVLDVAVFGIPDPDFGEQVKAVVQPVDWDLAGPSLEQELLAYCRGKLAAYKCPKSIDFERELPRSDTGKLFKNGLKARYWPQADARAPEVFT
jgi:long-chain acyl-CoA synthetase